MKTLQKIFLPFAWLAAFWFFSACDKKDDVQPEPLKADFAFTVSGTSSPTINFANLSASATAYSWDFGNGKTSADRDPSVSYTAAGTYNVTLTAKGSGGETKVSKTVTITNPSVTFTNTALTPVDLTVNGTLYAVPIGSFKTVDFGSGGKVTWSAKTSQKFTNGSVSGLEYLWASKSFTVYFGDAVSEELAVGKNYFFLRVNNQTNLTANKLTVNYLSATPGVQADNLGLFGKGLFGIGYYLVAPDSKVRISYTNGTSSISSLLTFPNTNNQTVTVNF
jgi:PKD repeat protein